MTNNSELAEIVGKTIAEVIVYGTDGDAIDFVFSDGAVATFWHEQECCEDVYLDDVSGDWDDLCDVPLLVAQERSSSRFDDVSETWTFYTFRTIKGSVDVKWYGTSNGYYSERVDFKLEKEPTQ